MIGDLSSEKWDIIAKYFNKSSYDTLMSLTEQGIVNESKIIECCNKKIKLDCLDTTQGTQNPEMFKNLIKC